MAFKRNAEDFVNEARGENEKKKERKSAARSKQIRRKQ